MSCPPANWQGCCARRLRRARGRLKLVTLSACLSAARTLDEAKDWLGLDGAPRRDMGKPALAAETAPSVARALVAALDCAVVAMRYSVEDDFAMALAGTLYENLFDKKQPLPRAAQTALRDCTGEGESRATGALSVATPALFGTRAAALRLLPPRAASDSPELPNNGLYDFMKREPPRFVGRVAAMTAASAALAEDSGKTGVLFHGMAGGGKTSCAVELALHHGDVGRFRWFVWYSGPETDSDVALSLRNFAMAMESRFEKLAMVHLVDRTSELKVWLPNLMQLLRTTGVLIVLDNLETLLTPDGQWRDPNWGLVVEALLSHGGQARTVLTSRVRPADLPDAMTVIPVHALPLDEALLLMRDLPHLGALLRGRAAGIATEHGRALVRRTLRLVQGHPKLIELAEGQAADPAALARQLDRAEAGLAAGEAAALDAFFRDGASARDAEAFLRDLSGWTGGIAATLPDAARIFFHFLCAIEEEDRQSWIVLQVWPVLWKALGRPEPAPEPAAAIDPLAAAGLVALRQTGEDSFDFLLHPGVADSGRAASGDAFREAADAKLAAFWQAVMRQSLEAEGKEPWAGPLIRRAGLAGAPYLMRRQEWAAASALLQSVLTRDCAPTVIAALQVLLLKVSEAAAGTKEGLESLGFLANALWRGGRAEEAEQALRDGIAEAELAGFFRAASGLSSYLVDLLGQAGRPREALHELERMKRFFQRADLGPWTQVTADGRRLQILNILGLHREVSTEVERLRRLMAELPDPPASGDPVHPWKIREVTLNTGFIAAQALKRWQTALDLNAENLESKRNRGASALELARTRLNDGTPLIRLERFAEARALLTECRSVFERERDWPGTAVVFSLLADLDDETVGPASARFFEERALRYHYLAENPSSSAVSHRNLSIYIHKAGGKPRDALAHRLAAVLLAAAMESGELHINLDGLASDLAHFGPAGRAALPGDFAELCATVEQVEGVRFREAFDRLASPRDITGDDLMQQVIAAVIAALDQPSDRT